MSEQLGYAIVAASIGFISALMFCIGSVLNFPRQILEQATPFWDFSEPVARSLAAQRSQYLVGALLLVVAFAIQITAALASPSNQITLPIGMEKWYWLVVVTLLPTGLAAIVLAKLIYRTTVAQVLALAGEQRRAEENARGG